MHDRHLPLTAPDYCRFDITRTATQGYTLTHYWADGPGFVSARASESYPALTWGELCDVMGAILDSQGRSLVG